ncbi:glycosyl hydrolase family 18 protein [Francisella tularensis]|uniref:glycosyl hydrolase family 18 protein n=1 Tax=Francisella tularensis TaxID=263 RepID=UPI0018A88CC8|nr:glycosyl hydrolase family 18 protein [Francisella tularensis]MBF8995924.1 chitinase [Francisella tularensis]MBF9003709.1 chitinase [Francisella tularensis]
MRKLFINLILLTLIFPLILQAEPLSDSDSSSSKSLLPNRTIVGFLDIRTPGSTTRVDMQKVKKDGYNVMIVAYGEVYDDNIGFYTNSVTSTQTIIDKIRDAKKAGMKVLLAVGGSPNTFHPGVKQGAPDPKIFGNDLTDAQIKSLANNIVSFLNKNDIDGILYCIKKFTSPEFITKLSADIKKINAKIIIAAEPEVNNYKLVTTGLSNDYDKAIEDGNIDYLFIQEYNTYPEYDPNFISESYPKIIESVNIPIKTKILIEEPTNAVSGGTNTIYHPQGNATKSLSTEQAIKLLLPQLEKLKFKPRFAGVAGWSLNTDYAADLYGDSSHNAGAFAKGLSACIYKNTCTEIDNQIHGPVVAGILPLWGKSSSYNISGQQINTIPISISMPKDKEYCDYNPNVCKYNVIIAAYLTYTSSKGFELSFNEENGSSKKIYSPEELKAFITYMNSKGKHTIVSIGGKYSHINWETINFSDLVKIVQEYGFNGINFDLSSSDMPKNDKVAKIAADKINKLITALRQNNHGFWLTFSPEWHYIVAPLAKNDKDNIYVNHNYIELLDSLGMNKIDYIWLNTFADKPYDGILSFYKDKDGEHIKITPADGYAKFLASLAWALTTRAGYDANMPKYDEIDKPLHIPANKLVLMIPATKGTTHSDMVYVLSEKDIKEVVSLMKGNNASFAGFAVWSIDFDATNINNGDLGNDYSHKPWSTTAAISDISLPPIVSQLKDQIKQETKATSPIQEQEQSIDTGIINYPDKIGAYNVDTIINFQGKKYKCKSNLEVKLCNDKGYIPNGLYGYLAWDEIDSAKQTKVKRKQRKLAVGEIVKYPKFIGNYNVGQIVIAGDRKFECQKQELCNDKSYRPIGKSGYLAWSDITGDVAHLATEAKQVKPKGAEYIYPFGIEDYSAGTVVAIGQELYRCKVGPESSLCNSEAYKPTGKYGTDAWTKIDSK